MSLPITRLDNLYKRYGYTITVADESFRVYGIRQGLYYCVDIVPLNNEADVEKLSAEYSMCGYATRINKYTNIEEAENALFSGYFDLEGVGSHLKNLYDRYVKQRTLNIGYDYEYIPCPFRLFDTEDSLGRDETIVESILDILKKDTPQLLIVEAAAGFGKTSTAYEILNSLISGENQRNPIFAELSRNRTARIFRYVLLDEIDRVYPSLNSALVEHEIQSGRIPLVIDGFDELLQKSSDKKTDEGSFDTVESMLETIGDLLSGKAKIILTSRRTAIFSGDDFHKWLEKKSEQFTITRYKIDRPDIASWIGADRLDFLNSINAPIDYLCNPVLLSYIKNLSQKEFGECCTDVDKLVTNYFTSLLEREMGRQDLRIDPDAQFEIFKNLAYDMVAYDITSEDKDFLGEIVKERNEGLLETVRHSSYTSADRPTMDELLETLLNHALLDRLGAKEDNIGFINQFVFGYMIGCAALESEDAWLQDSFASEQYISLSSTAFRVRSNKYKERLYEKIVGIEDMISNQGKLIIDLELLRRANHAFEGATFETLTISNVTLAENCSFANSIFSECKFINVAFSPRLFRGVNFLDCSFSDCSLLGDLDTVGDHACWFSNCEDYGTNFVLNFIGGQSAEPEKEVDLDEVVELEVLRQFWPKGRPSAVLRRKVRTLFAGFDPEMKNLVPVAIEGLRKKRLIHIDGSYATLNREKMKEIIRKLEA